MSSSRQSHYKYCIVPLCTNTTANTNEKIFFSVPKDSVIRKRWTNVMKRDEKRNPPLSNKTTLWCCEDHFSLEDDMENYMEWRLLKRVKQFKLKQGVVPHRFECQKLNNHISIERKGAKKRKHIAMIVEVLSSTVASTSTCQLKEECVEKKMADDDDDVVRPWKFDEIEKYMLSKIGELVKDPNCNKLLALERDIKKLHEDSKSTNEKLLRLKKTTDTVAKDHQIFFSRMGLESKIKYRSVAIGVDFPIIHVTAPASVQNPAKPNSEDNSGVKKANAATLVKKDTGPVECIDLTSEDEPAAPATPVLNKQTNSNSTQCSTISPNLNQTKHPAPLPPVPLLNPHLSDIPPKPLLKISVDKNGIVLQWDMPPEAKGMKITNFEIFGYQEKKNVPPSSSQWEKIGSVRAMPLPMSCTLTQFIEGSKYHFCIRSTTNTNKLGLFSDPASIMFVSEKK